MSTNFDQPEENIEIQQHLTGDRNQSIGQIYGGIIVYGQAYINSSELNSTKPVPSKELGANPYKGLLAFNENDHDRYFGRSEEIQELWNRFRDLHRSQNEIRLLPIYGPSGSGKSSLVRAGLLPELGKNPVPGRDHARVAVLIPGTQPLQALATILARIASPNDPLPISKQGEIGNALKEPNEQKQFNGLQRVASMLPDIETFPLIVLVDQFEEVYSLCKDETERDQFIQNLLYAANDASHYVSVILTCRSDFLAETQQHPTLNNLFTQPGYLVPIMQPQALMEAVLKPAKQAGYEEFRLDTARYLVGQTHGQQGALPLLQFALQRIWEGLEQGVEPLATLEKIGGVGGALAHEVEQLYASLSIEDQRIARRIFVALVQVDDENNGTRRRALLNELLTNDHDAERVEGIIRQFADPSVRFLVTSSDAAQRETVEVAHEVLIQNWKELQGWLDQCRDDLRQKRLIEHDADEWERRGELKDYLLQGRPLRDAKEYRQTHQDNEETKLSSLASSFVMRSIKKEQIDTVKRFVLFAIFPLAIIVASIPITHIFLLDQAKIVFDAERGCSTDLEAKFLLRYMLLLGKGAEGANFCNENLNGMDLSGSILWKADFSNSFLEDANLNKAMLVDVNFQGASLKMASFDEAILDGAIFKDSILYKTDLEKAHGLVEEQINTALLCQTLLPKSFHLNSNRDCGSLGYSSN